MKWPVWAKGDGHPFLLLTSANKHVFLNITGMISILCKASTVQPSRKGQSYLRLDDISPLWKAPPQIRWSWNFTTRKCFLYCRGSYPRLVHCWSYGHLWTNKKGWWYTVDIINSVVSMNLGWEPHFLLVLLSLYLASQCPSPWFFWQGPLLEVLLEAMGEHEDRQLRFGAGSWYGSNRSCRLLEESGGIWWLIDARYFSHFVMTDIGPSHHHPIL